MNGVVATKAGRVRSLGGCFTCRKRHIKCDEVRPSCQQCNAQGVECGGYKARIAFDTDHVDAETLRRPLYTPQEQHDMTVSLAASAPFKTLHKVLMRLDESTPDAAVIASGPFAVFRACKDGVLEAAQHSIPSDDSTIELVDEALLSDFDANIAAFNYNEAIDALFPDLFPSVGGDMTNFASHQPDAIMDLPEVSLFEFANCIAPGAETDFTSFNHGEVAWSSPPIIEMPTVQSALPSEAVYLLANYKDTVIGYLSPLHRRKTIWHVLHIPSSMVTVAALTMGEDPGDARITVFYAMLSVSASCLRGESDGKVAEFWLTKAHEFRTKAQQHLSCTLQKLAQPGKQEKYKEVLMALLAMVIAALFTGESRHAPLYLFDADKFIRLKGLRKRRKSRKLRMLHHYYCFLRMFYESTALHQISSAEQHYRCVQPDTEDSIDVEAQQDHPFRLARWQLPLDEKMLEEKSQDRGENDLCLQEPGLWNSTMYPEIFGVPESWLGLLSQSIRLGNERDIASERPGESSLSWQEFSSRAQALERCISSWQAPNNKHSHEQSQYIEDGSTVELVEYMLCCLHAALRIYFYRRIYNVDAVILQHQVTAIRQTLQKCDSHADVDERLKYSAGFLWPAWIGACEALDRDDQDFYLEWFASLEKARFHTAQSALTVIRYIWQQRRETNDNTSSWMQYLRHHRMNLVFF